MLSDEIKNIKSKIFVYNIEPFNSLGIYIGESKEEALKSINSEIWDDVDFSIFYPSKEEERKRLKEMFEDNLNDELISDLMKIENEPINIYDSIKIWTWEEYQEQQGFNVSERLLEIIN